MVEARNQELPAQSTSSQPPKARSGQEEQKGDRQSRREGGKIVRDDELVINTSEQIEIVTSFDQLGISEQLLRGKLLVVDVGGIS